MLDALSTNLSTQAGFDLSIFRQREHRRTVAEVIADELAACEGCAGLPCRKTRNQGLIPSLTDGVVTYDICAPNRRAARQRELERRLQGARIPERYLGKTYADYKVDANNRDAVAYAHTALKTRRGAFFFGDRGTGKTFLAAIIAQEFINGGLTVAFEKVPSLLAAIIDTFGATSAVTEAQILDAATTADLLVLDDFGMEKPTRFAGTTLCSIIDARYDNPRLTTIITSNYPFERIRTELDSATDGESFNGSRIVDRCKVICKPILFRGNSRR